MPRNRKHRSEDEQIDDLEIVLTEDELDAAMMDTDDDLDDDVDDDLDDDIDDDGEGDEDYSMLHPDETMEEFYDHEDIDD